MSLGNLTPEEIVNRGERIYREKLRPVLEPAHNGEFVVIDIETGEYELDKDHLAASDRAAAKKPGALRFVAKVGSRTLGRMGGRITMTK